MKYYISNTFLDPTHSRSRYAKIVYNKEQIAYHVWDPGYLADQENIKRTNQKKKYNNFYNIAIFLCIVLADKGYIGDYKVTVSAIAKIHS